MKKMMIFAAFAAALTLASCQKEVAEKPVPGGSSVVTEAPVFTATISKGTKTTVNASSGKVSWEAGDSITVKDGEGTAIYKCKSIDKDGKATFEYKSGAIGDGPYTATYGTAPATEQTYTETPGQLYMIAISETTSLTFSVQCGLMEINLTKAGEDVKKIVVSGDNTYTLNCTNAQSIESQRSFYIAVAGGSYNKIVITDSGNKVCTLTAASGVLVETNHIKPLTFDENKLDFRVLGGGVFTVDVDKRVLFSRGNLQATYTSDGTYTWGFAKHQYDFIGQDEGNTTIGSQQAGKVVDLFGWVGTDNKFNNDDAKIFGISTSTNTEDYGNTEAGGRLQADWGTKIGAGWRTLTADEWDYLFNTRDASKVGGVSNARYAMAKVNEVNGVILLPDTYTHPEGVDELTNVNPANSNYVENTYLVGDWEKLEAAGAVFLPAAGHRIGSSVDESNISGYYWSSTPGANYFLGTVEIGNDAVYHVYFNGNKGIKAKPVFADYCFTGSSVRLVTDCHQ